MSDSFPGVSRLQLLSGDWPGKGVGEIRSQAKQYMEWAFVGFFSFACRRESWEHLPAQLVEDSAPFPQLSLQEWIPRHLLNPIVPEVV